MKTDIFFSWRIKSSILKELPEYECVTSAMQNSGIPGVSFGLKVYSFVYDESTDHFNVVFALIVKSNFDVKAEFGFFICSNGFSRSVPYYNFHSSNDECKIYVKEVDEFYSRNNGFFNDSGLMKLEVRGTFTCWDYRYVPVLGDVLLNADDKDFAIIAEKKVIYIHKTILRQYSSVFERMFVNQFKESEQSRVDIIDFRFDTVRNAVNFCYGKLGLLDLLQMIDLLRFADKYDMKRLKDEIEERLSDMVEPSIVVFVANEVRLYASNVLIDSCIKTLVECARKSIFVIDNEKLNQEIKFKVLDCLFNC